MRIAICDNDMDFVLRLKGAIDDCFPTDYMLFSSPDRLL